MSVCKKKIAKKLMGPFAKKINGISDRGANVLWDFGMSERDCAARSEDLREARGRFLRRAALTQRQLDERRLDGRVRAGRRHCVYRPHAGQLRLILQVHDLPPDGEENKRTIWSKL